MEACEIHRATGSLEPTKRIYARLFSPPSSALIFASLRSLLRYASQNSFHVERDGKLITGQNPQSSASIAQAVIEAI